MFSCGNGIIPTMDLHRRFNINRNIIPIHTSSFRYSARIEYLPEKTKVNLEFGYVVSETFESDIKMALKHIADQVNDRYLNKLCIQVRWLEKPTVMAVTLGKRIVMCENYAKQCFQYNCFRANNDVENSEQTAWSKEASHLKVICWFKLIRGCRHG